MTVAGVWNELLNVCYISASPGVQYRYKMPAARRADNNPHDNQQPWYHGSNFAQFDPSTQNVLGKKGKKQ